MNLPPGMSVLDIVAIVALILTLVTVIIQSYLLRKQMKEEHEWRRRERALLYSQFYSPELRTAKQAVNTAFGYIQARVNPMTTEELNAAFKKTPGLRDEVNFILAYLENIGLAVRHNIASFNVIYDLLGNTYLKYYFLFQPFINNGRNHNPRLWENIEFLVHEIESERRKRKEEAVRLPKLG